MEQSGQLKKGELIGPFLLSGGTMKVDWGWVMVGAVVLTYVVMRILGY